MSQPKPRLLYFDAPVSRGEECRIALHLAGIDFEDVRIPFAEWPKHKDAMPYGQMPVLELPGQAPLAQCNAILCYVGRLGGLHPTDPLQAAQHEALMGHVEDLRGAVSPSLRISDPEEKRKVREALAATTIPRWAEQAEAQLARLGGDGPFVAGAALNVADLKLYMAIRWFASSNVDYVPATIFDAYPRLVRLYDAVRAHPGVRRWLDRT